MISELMRDKASQQVLEWIDGHPSDDLYISAVNRGEIERGLNLMRRAKGRLARKLVAAEIFESLHGRPSPSKKQLPSYSRMSRR